MFLRGVQGRRQDLGLHAGGEALGIKLVDGESAMATLRAARAADEPGACVAGRIGQGCVQDLHELVVALRQAHAGKDKGFSCSAL